MKQHSTTNAGLFLTHLIHTSWVTDLHMSTLAFDIAQFFPSLNHYLLLLILNKAYFDLTISSFFYNYLIYRKTQYIWNNFISPSFRADMSIDQGFALSPILSTLYITLIFEKRSKSLLPNIPIFFHSFIDDGFFISQERSYEKSNVYFFVVMISFSLSLINLYLYLNIANQRFSIFLGLQETSISLLWILVY